MDKSTLERWLDKWIENWYECRMMRTLSYNYGAECCTMLGLNTNKELHISNDGIGIFDVAKLLGAKWYVDMSYSDDMCMVWFMYKEFKVFSLVKKEVLR